MKRLIALALCLLLLTGCVAETQTTDSAESVTFQDDTGAQVTVACQPKTVAVLTSSLADLWLSAGGTVEITVGETVSRGFAPETVVLVDDGAGKTIDLERLIAAKPDFVLYSSELSGQLSCAETLRQAGIPAAGFQVDTFADYLRLLKICTDIMQTPQAYQTNGVEVKERVDDLLALANNLDQDIQILFVRAGSSAKYTKAKTAENHFVCQMLKDLGTENIAEKAPVLLDGLSTEEIVLADPDAIFYTTMGDETAGVVYMQSLLDDPVWQSLTAVQTGRVYQLPKELFQYKPNARWDEAYAHLIRLLYGVEV